MKIDKTKTGLIGLITLLAVFGGSLYLTPDQLSNAYYCTASEEIGIFYGGISGTGLTAYPYLENRTGYVRCNKVGVKGVWISLVDYAEEIGIDPLLIISKPENVTLKQIVISYPNGKIYECVFEDTFIDNTIKSNVQCNLKGG